MASSEQLHTTILNRPAKQSRRDRKALDRATKRAIADAQTASRAQAKAERMQTRREADQAQCLPAAGEPGPAQLRTPARFRLPAHQDTTATLAGAYPFLTEGGLDSEGVFVGQDMFGGSSFVFDPWVLSAQRGDHRPNIVLAGIVGSGKSSLAKSLYTRSMPFGRRVDVPGDRQKASTPRSPRPSAACPSDSATACPPD